MQLYCALRICDLEMSYWCRSRDVNILYAINNSQLPNAAMTRTCGILHIGRAHRAAHEGGPLCRKEESCISATGAYISDRLSHAADTASCMLVRSARASRGHILHIANPKDGGGLSLDSGVSAIINHTFTGRLARLYSVRMHLGFAQTLHVVKDCHVCIE
jgi:hypothetical protein